ncbi:lanthionine synthetase C family protein [Streptomyces sp. NBC_01485]|uniref:lanthionine synthetase C family protein n=1 Tax=Streptomyces sp. NBC_01485 TaxID=2903884 RepID=UPI002E2F8747|nr:lanthionine synthetase C family protein [Streptomyces sp. NBC_01485]
MSGDPAIRARAAETAGWVAERLSDPARVRAVADWPGAHWSSASLDEGHAGVALLFGAQADDPQARRLALRHLSAGVAARTHSGGGLFHGDVALAFAAAVAARSADDYRTVRAAGTATAVRLVQRLARAPRTLHRLDVVSGLAGIGRYLLADGQTDALCDVLRLLVELTRPVHVHGRTVPGWWVGTPPTAVDRAQDFPQGHFNLGMAHGVSGPLALLSLATAAGVTVPGQTATVRAMAQWLVDRLHPGPHGPYWPDRLTFEEEARGRAVRPPARGAWCYGTPGVARAVHLAGGALGQRQWCDAALGAVRVLFGRPAHEWPVRDASLCHGAAGLLVVGSVMAADSGDTALAAVLPALAERVLAFFDESAPFGFRYTDAEMELTEDRAGTLMGAAGVALALRHFADPVPRQAEVPVPWEAALLVC